MSRWHVSTMGEGRRLGIRRCGDCLLFHTPKCTWQYSYSPVPSENPKEISTMKELLEWLYDFERNPLQKFVVLYTQIRVTDYACGHFIPYEA